MGQKNMGYRGVRFWNNLVDEAKEAMTFFAFERIFLKKNKTIDFIQGHFHSY